jgi:GntR family transcriptional repressor for pyruvate dehydrogenase complex
VELATQHATEEEIQEMGLLVEDMTAAIKKGGRDDEYGEKDFLFHHMIAKSTHNQFMIHLFLTIRGLMEQFIKEGFSVLPGMFVHSLKDHKNIYEAIKNRNTKKAINEMTKHQKNVQAAIEQYYDFVEEGGKNVNK